MGLFKWLRRAWFPPPAASIAPDAEPPTPNAATVGEAWSVLSNVNEWVKHAETKLGVVLAFLGVLAAGLISLVIEVGHPSRCMLVVEGIAGGLLLLAVACASLGLLPQFDHETDEANLNPLYYGDIRRYFASKPLEYSTHLKSALTSAEVMTEQLARQIVANSGVAVRKYTWSNRAIILGFLALMATIGVVAGLVLGW